VSDHDLPAPRGVVLNADKLDLIRDGRTLLDRVTLTVLTGEHWALLGPNGAGKSTLLGILGAYTHPTRGAAGPADQVLTTELISECFDHPIAIARRNGRWTAGH
jgi:ABC-type molybdenum transport system ATPase subunit/photorepair protein PhrA